MNKKRVPITGRVVKGTGLVSLGLTMLLGLSSGQFESGSASASQFGRVSVSSSVIKQQGRPSHKTQSPGALNSPNPYLSFLPVESEPDYAAWRERLTDEGQSRHTFKSIAAAARPSAAKLTIPYGESEPAGTNGQNDLRPNAKFIAGLGTGIGDDGAGIRKVQIKDSILGTPITDIDIP